MNIKQDIASFNSKQKHHGYHESYTNGRLLLRGTYNNGLEMGYSEWHLQYCESQTNFYIR
jgi:hypothetical protein